MFHRWDADIIASRSSTPTVLFFGRIYRYKGLDVLVDAEPKVSALVPDARFVVAGTGDALDECCSRMVHPDRFAVTDRRLSEAETSVLFREAWVVVLPYLEASQSAVAAIAMAYGVPVVATSVGGLPEAVYHGRSGTIVPPGDPDALADAIAEILLDAQKRARLAQGARDLATGELSWARVAELTEEVYMEVVAP